MRLTVAAGLLLCTLLACQSATEPAPTIVVEARPSDAVAIRDTTIQLTTGRPVVWILFPAEFSVSNTGSRSVFMDACHWFYVERREPDDSWRPVWTLGCLSAPPMRELRAGANLTFSLYVGGSVSGYEYADWEEDFIPGEFRFVVRVPQNATLVEGMRGPRVEVRSNPISVRW